MSTASTSTLATQTASSRAFIALTRQWAADYAALLKLRITLMVLVTAWAGFYLGCCRSGISSWNIDLLHALLGVALTSCGAGALNQVMERVYDGRMARTAGRPMPAGRIGLLHGLSVGMVCVAGGTLLLAYYNLLTSMLALLTVFLYVAVYTPLKRFTTLATFVGAVPGAIPPMLGWTAARGAIEAPAIALFAILFVWQFPHFMAIAWLYRHDYAKAGIRMLPVVEPDGKSTVRQALAYAMLMLPVSLAPVWLRMAGMVYAASAVALGLGYLWATLRFRKIVGAATEAESRSYARALLKASVLYLPLLLGMMTANAVARPQL